VHATVSNVSLFLIYLMPLSCFIMYLFINDVFVNSRRLAAMGVAERVAAEQCSELGDTIGYQVRIQ
jgi:hypothetical protein